MKRFFGVVFFVLMAGSVFAGHISVTPLTGPISAYKPVYFVAGDYQDQVKMQVSLKYDVFYPNKIGLYVGYTQLMFWKLYDASSPFSQIDFMPDFFWRFESGHNFLDDLSIPFVDYFQTGYEHRSNGEKGMLDRGMDRLYVEAQLRAGNHIQVGIWAKYFYIFSTSTLNSDISTYIGSFEGKVFVRMYDEYKHLNQEEVYLRFGPGGGENGTDFMNGWAEFGFKSRAFFSRIRPYVQIYSGYCESILDYNKRKENSLLNTSVRVGIILE